VVISRASAALARISKHRFWFGVSVPYLVDLMLAQREACTMMSEIVDTGLPCTGGCSMCEAPPGNRPATTTSDSEGSRTQGGAVASRFASSLPPSRQYFCTSRSASSSTVHGSNCSKAWTSYSLIPTSSAATTTGSPSCRAYLYHERLVADGSAHDESDRVVEPLNRHWFEKQAVGCVIRQ